MPILNEHLEFDHLRREDQRAFLGRPEKVLLSARTSEPTLVYKWTNKSAAWVGEATKWWSFAKPFRLASGRTIDGLETILERAARVHAQRQQARQRPEVAAAEDAARSLRSAGNTLTSRQEYARAAVALSDRFNNAMSRFLVAELLSPIWGLAGRTAAQPEFKDIDDVFLIGGADQLCIPNMEWGRDVRARDDLGLEDLSWLLT